MTQEQKELLLKDLCARLPYGVQVFVEHDKYSQATLFGVNTKQFSIVFGGNNWSSTSNIEGHSIEQYRQLVKPYLRPMSSMTDEEKKEYDSYACFNGFSACSAITDWLIYKHFDFRGLIPMGLALEALEGMYNN